MQDQWLQSGVTFLNPIDIILIPETNIIVGKWWNHTMSELIAKNAKYYKHVSDSSDARFE
jgi:hypothetical protein